MCWPVGYWPAFEHQKTVSILQVHNVSRAPAHDGNVMTCTVALAHEESPELRMVFLHAQVVSKGVAKQRTVHETYPKNPEAKKSGLRR